jgi:phosphomannomutase / phosphoglucomutase
MKPNPEIFREYDIRGIVGRDLTTEVAFEIGRAVGSRVRREGGERVLVGRDCRVSGAELTRGIVEGLIATGIVALDAGVTPTPVNYWGIQTLGTAGGIEVTGSHNPPEYNGFKVTLADHTLYGDEIQALRRDIDAGHFESGRGRVETRSLLEGYTDDLAKRLKPAARPMKIVIDAGNGTGGLTAVPLYERLGYEVVPLYCELDGKFPHHHPDPTVELNLADLRAAVAAHHAEIGIAFDGDADRVGVIDKGGEVVWGDRLLIVLARALLQEVPGAAIIGEVKCSKSLYDDIAKRGGRPIMWRAGHSLIKAKMKAEGAELAGEMSGHIFFKHRYYGFDDAVYAGGRLLEILSQGRASVAELLADVPAFVSTPELRVDCTEALKVKLVEEVRRRFAACARAEGFHLVDIDGVRVEWADGWGLVRCSNTQPILVLRFEAETSIRLAAIQARFDRELEAARKTVSP